MKSEIHPNYVEAVISCACGNQIKTRATVKEMHVNTCSAVIPSLQARLSLLIPRVV